ncbi:hypothetical protein [Bradyrhizobium sp. dw_78]|uniref:hypothetical protein n=1 Tax=Bradyrhizobium sp. dw_78 TaxID=2719793 RepID=UPI001BD687EF|nr:hypothetical protein [Bradyrhizobium sp. dw_78]
MAHSQSTDDDLRAELEGLRLALGAPLGQPFDGREERNKADLLLKIEEIRTELEKRRLPRQLVR